MKKLLLTFLLGVMLMTGVMAASFISPVNGAHISEESEIKWNNPTGIPEMWLQYAEGNCSFPGAWENEKQIDNTSELSYPWDTEDLDDGEYCLRLQVDSTTYDQLEVIVDNEAPEVEFTVTENPATVFESIAFDGTGSTDNHPIVPYLFSWDFDDGNTASGPTASHTYDEVGNYEVTLTVADLAGNEGYATVEVLVNDLPLEEGFVYEAGIKSILDLHETFESGLTSPTCTYLGTAPTGLVVSSNIDNCTLDWTNIDYEYRGEHSFVIKATDGTDIKYFPVDLTVYTWMISLIEGWNQVSIPMMPSEAEYREVLDGIRENLAEVWTFAYSEDDEQNIWHKRATTSTSWSTATSNNKGDLDYVVPGQGYLLKMDAADTLKGFGSMTPETDGMFLGVDVENGWNLIGHYGLDTLIYGQALSSLKLGSTKYWNSVVSDSGNIEKYVGYWMTAKFLPEDTALYTPSQLALDSVL